MRSEDEIKAMLAEKEKEAKDNFALRSGDKAQGWVDALLWINSGDWLDDDWR